MDFSASFWNFFLFQSEVLRRQAVVEAGEADMIVVVRIRQCPLPGELKDWMAEWPLRRGTGPAALVALENLAEEGCQRDKTGIAYMRAVADNRGLDFFCNLSHEGGQGEEPDRFGFIPEKLIRAIPAERVSFGGPLFYRDWGINE